MKSQELLKPHPTHETYNETNSDIWVECSICQARVKGLVLHLSKAHGYSVPKYREEYPGSEIHSVNYKRQASLRMQGENNPWHNHGGKYSPFSEKSVVHTKEVREAAFKKARENTVYNTQIEYYTSRGHSEEQSRILLTKRQRTFTLERCIERFGEQEGYNKWAARQEKWQNTMNSKSDEEKSEINRKRISKVSLTSNKEKELKNLILELGIELDEKQKRLKRDSSRSYYYDISIRNKIIEFNGTFYHADPRFYQKDDLIFKKSNITAESIWKNDEEKKRIAESHGYEFLVVWEHDFINRKEEILEECKNFLTA